MINKLEKDIEDIAQEKTELLESIKEIESGPQDRKVLEKTRSLKLRLTGLSQIKRELKRALEVESLKRQGAELRAKVEACTKEINKAQADLDHIVEYASDVEKEIFGKYSLRALNKTAALLNKMDSLNENCKYYLEEIRRLNLQIQELSEPL